MSEVIIAKILALATLSEDYDWDEYTISDGLTNRTYRIRQKGDTFDVQMTSNYGKSWHTYGMTHYVHEDALNEVLHRVQLDAEIAVTLQEPKND